MSGDSRTSVAVNRIELPVLVGFNISALRIFGGPVFRLSDSEKSSNSDFRVKFNDSAVAAQFGIGFDIKKFFFDIRYTTYFGKVRNKNLCR
ncbi:MAG: outer membrane beta-barrel protein [Alistipes putredinis]|nr:MAG: outer membrane beta-barrel protein [Alistipes putredinis]